MKKALITIFFFISIVGNATTYFLSPTGNDEVGDGSIGSPWLTFNNAWTVITAGDTIYMRGGTYHYDGTTELYDKSGTSDNYISILAYNGEHPIMSFSHIANPPSYICGFLIDNVSYLHIKGIRITDLYQNTGGQFPHYGIKIYTHVSHVILELIECDHIGGWGFSIGDGGYFVYVDDILYLNCDSHHNADPYTDYDNNPPYGWSDGFQMACKATTNIVFRGCRAWCNSDDGWDLRDCDANVLIENCWSWNNGFIPDTYTSGGNGDGYKLGGKSAPATTDILRTVYNCISYNNRLAGFTPEPDSPENQLGVEIHNCIAYSNKLGDGSVGFNFQYDNRMILTNNISYDNDYQTYGTGANVTQDHNSWNGTGGTINDDDFVSITAALDDERQEDGSLPVLTFLHPKEGSSIIGVGTAVSGLTLDGDGNYWGTPPSIGAFEYIGENHAPSIIDQSFEIAENSPDGTIAGTVVASDPDAGQTLDYSILSGNTNDAFIINASSGVLSVANSAAVNIDFELVVKVQDNGTDNLSSQATITINVLPAGIEITGSNSTIKVYPNPVSDELIIEIEGNNDRQGYAILDSTGHIVFKGTLSERTVVPTTNFSPGIYFVKLQNGKTFEFKKIVKP
jgi:hypothetical protein